MLLLNLIGLLLIGTLHTVRGAARIYRPAAPTSPRRSLSWLLPATATALALLGLLLGGSAALPVPIGYGGADGGFLLDPLGGVFILLLFAVATESETSPSRSRMLSGYRDLRVAAASLLFLAGDTFLLCCGAILAFLLPARLVGLRFGRFVLLGAVALAGASTLLSGIATGGGFLLADPGFALLRISPGSTGFLLPVLVAVASAPLLGLWPARAGFLRQCAFAPAWVPITGQLLGFFLLLRLLLDLGGPVQSPLAGALLVVVGIGSALRSAWAGIGERRAAAAIGCVLAALNGTAVLAVGLCMLARGNDLPVLAGSALDVVMLLLPTVSLGGLCALRLARVIEREAGSGLLTRTGGLVHSMPRAMLLMTVPVLLLGLAPPLAGFTAFWLLLQTILATQLPLLAGVAVPSLLLLLTACVVAALSAVALLRLVLLAALGRPRTPRGAAALDPDRRVLRRIGAPLLLPLFVGAFPGLWLALAAGGFGAGADDALAGPRHPGFTVLSPAGVGSFSPLPLLVAVALAWVLAVLLFRLIGQGGERRHPGWDEGAAPPPPWLPFGDPATQIAPGTLASALEQALPLPDRRHRFAIWLQRVRLSPRRAVWRTRSTSLLLAGRVRRHGPLLAALLFLGLLLVILFDPAGQAAGR